jgi:hypothetical protein
MNDVSADVIGLLKWTTATLKGEDTSGFEDMTPEALAAKLTSHAAIIAELTSSTEALAGAIASANDETMNKMITPPWQMEAPMFMICMIAVNHIWYHDGQLNYFQALHGDKEVHWMDQ